MPPTQTSYDSAASANDPPSMGILETIAEATITATDRHLAALSLLPHNVDAPGVDTFAYVAPPPCARFTERYEYCTAPCTNLPLPHRGSYECLTALYAHWLLSSHCLCACPTVPSC